MDYDIDAIKTWYKGVCYRSRLEATWACFFDSVGWPHTYEPEFFDGWLPDFLLHLYKPVYVEVKPARVFRDMAVRNAVAKIDWSSCTDECLVVGNTIPVYGLADYDHPCLGWLRENVNGHLDWGDALMGVWKGDGCENKDRRPGFCHHLQSYRDRVTGIHDGGCFGEGTYDEPGGIEGFSRRMTHLWQQSSRTISGKEEECSSTTTTSRILRSRRAIM